MRYDLDFMNTFDKTLLFWIERFIRYKLTSLSNRQVNDKDKLAFIIQSLIKGTKSIDELSELYFLSIHSIRKIIYK